MLIDDNRILNIELTIHINKLLPNNMNFRTNILIAVLMIILVAQFSVAEDDEIKTKELDPVLITDEPIENTYLVEDASTATKTQTPIKYIPQSVEVIDQDLIKDQGATRLRDVIYNIPGAVPGEVSTLPFLIRGFQAEILRDGLTPSRFLFVNRSEEELTNVQRIEAVQGPESILYGNVAAGGIINLITKQPLPTTFVSPELYYGSFDFYRASIDITGPILPDKSVLGRFNGSYTNTNSFRRFVEEEVFFFSPVLSWYITPKVKLTFDGEYHNLDTPLDEGLVAVGSKVANIPVSRNLAEPGDTGMAERYSSRITLESELTDNIKMRNTFRYYKVKVNIDDHQPLFLLPDDRTLIRTATIFTQDDDIYTTQNELFVKFNVGSIENNFLFGVEFVRENFEIFSRAFETNPIDILDPVYGGNTPDPPLLLAINRFGDTNNLGIYAQDQFTLFENLYILAGIRYDLIDQSIDNENPLLQTDFQASQTDSKFSPRIGILYQFIEEMSVYGSFVQGFNLSPRAGLSIDGKIFDPQRLTQLEGGFKFDLFDSRIFSTISYFWLLNKDFVVEDPLNPFYFGLQIEKARSQGIEVSITGQIIPEWNFTANYSFIDTEVLKDDFFQEGNELPAVPKNSASLWTTYFQRTGVLEGAGVGFGVTAQSNRQGDLENTFKLGSFVRFDAALYYNIDFGQSGNLQASVNFRNITDERYFANSVSRVFIIPGEPFNVLASLRYYYE